MGGIMGGDTFEIGTPLIRLMMEIGYLAAGNGFSAEAEAIFEGLHAVRPGSEIPFIGLAVTRMNAGRPLEAASLLEEQALRLSPASELAQGFLGLAPGLTFGDSQSTCVQLSKLRALPENHDGGHADGSDEPERGQQDSHRRPALGPLYASCQHADRTRHDRTPRRKRLQVFGKSQCTGVTFSGNLLQAFQADCLQVSRDLGLQPLGRDGIVT